MIREGASYNGEQRDGRREVIFSGRAGGRKEWKVVGVMPFVEFEESE